MTIVGLLVIIFGLMLSFAFAIGSRAPICVFLYLYHTTASFLYWLYSLTDAADSVGYYTAPHVPSEIKPGTHFVTWLTVELRNALDASYLDLFMVFQLAGYIGIVVLFHLCRSTVRQGQDNDDTPPYLVYLLILLPGLHVWTSAIGKDSLIFLGISFVLWGAARRGFGLLLIALGLALCAMIRPHIASLLAASCGAALALSRGVPLYWRVSVLALLSVALWFGLPQLEEFLKVDEFNATNMVEYVEQRQGRNLGGGSSVAIADYSLPYQMFTFLYRPLFIDANGVLGLVVSFENLIYLAISVAYLPRAIGLVIKGEDSFFLRFNFLNWLLGAMILASSTSNLGLAIRQKTMLAPSLIVVALIAYARSRQGYAAHVEDDRGVAAV